MRNKLVERSYVLQRLGVLGQARKREVEHELVRRYHLEAGGSVERDAYRVAASIPNITRVDTGALAKVVRKMGRRELEELVLVLAENLRSAKPLSERDLGQVLITEAGTLRLRLSCTDKIAAAQVEQQVVDLLDKIA